MEIGTQHTSHQVTGQFLFAGNHPQHSALPGLFKQVRHGWACSEYRSSRMPTQTLTCLHFDQWQQRELLALCQPRLRTF